MPTTITETVSDSDRQVMEARYLRARKCQLWAHVCLAVGILSVYAGGLILVIVAIFLYRKRKKILAEGPVIEVTASPEEKARRNKRFALVGGAVVALIAVLAYISGTGSPLEREKVGENAVRQKLTGTFYDYGKRIKNPLHGSLNGQKEYLDFTNYKYLFSLSPDGTAMTIADSKEGSYGGVNLPGGASMKNTTYTLGYVTLKNGKDVWMISFADAPLSFPEKEFIICERGFRSVTGVYGDYSFSKKSSDILRTRDDVASFLGIK